MTKVKKPVPQQLSPSSSSGITDQQSAFLMRAGFAPSELRACSKYAAGDLIDVVLCNGGRKLDSQQLEALRDKTPNANHSTEEFDAELFDAELKIKEENLHYQLSAIKREFRKESARIYGDLFVPAPVDLEHATKKARAFAWYRKHISHNRWAEFCDNIGVARRTADALARIGDTMITTPQPVKEDLCSRGYNPLRSQDQWIFRASTKKYEELLGRAAGVDPKQ